MEAKSRSWTQARQPYDEAEQAGHRTVLRETMTQSRRKLVKQLRQAAAGKNRNVWVSQGMLTDVTCLSIWAVTVATIDFSCVNATRVNSHARNRNTIDALLRQVLFFRFHMAKERPFNLYLLPLSTPHRIRLFFTNN